MKKLPKVLIFDEPVKKRVLSALHKSIDTEGYIIEKNTSKRVLTPNGEEIKYNEFVAFHKGSEIFYKEDIVDLVKLYDELYDAHRLTR